MTRPVSRWRTCCSDWARPRKWPRPPPALSCKREGPHDRIVMSSRVRLARNLKGFSFPGWAKKADRVKALEVVRPAVESLPQMSAAFSETMDNLSAMDKQILVERHLISREHAARGVG